MTCETIRPLIAELLTGAVDEAARSEVEAHLAGRPCPGSLGVPVIAVPGGLHRPGGR